MNAAPLQLEHYALLGLHLEPAPGGTPADPGTYVFFADAKFSSTVKVDNVQLPNGEPRHTVELTLDGSPKPDSAFAYTFTIKLVGFFDGRQLPELDRDAIVAVNGASMLYGVAREMLLSITSRAAQGPVMLPSVNFAQIGEQIKRQRASATIDSPVAEPADPG